VERWQSGLTRTPGKREYPKGIGGSNPPLSAINLFDYFRADARVISGGTTA
jgi:hypothetical protein